MTESTDINTVETDGLCMEISKPNLIVLPIPEDSSSSNNSVQIGVYITNNASTSFRLNPNDPLIPKLITSNDQTLPGQIATDEQESRVQINIPSQSGFGFRLTQLISNLARLFTRGKMREFDNRIIHPGEGEYISVTARLVWCNSNLQLQVLNSPGYLAVIFRLDSSWFFDALQSGTYHLQFTYGSPSGSESRPDLEIREGVGARQLTTQLVNLRLIEPVGSDNSVVEVDGIRFETLMPERTLNVPLTQPNASISVQIGICITNQTAIPIRFNLFATLIPRLMGADGQAIHGGRSRLGTIRPLESDFPLAMPGECVTFFPYAKLLRHKDNQFTLSIAAGDGSIWTFEALKPNTYQIQLTYNNKKAEVEIYDRTSMNINRIEGLWVGMVATPSVTFRLVQP
jgi:hypothetical protein